MVLVGARLGEVTYFAGNEFTAEAIMRVFSLTTMRLFQPMDVYQANPSRSISE